LKINFGHEGPLTSTNGSQHRHAGGKQHTKTNTLLSH
jgi:hypothetical protein